jgi:hypothetical protein
MKTKEEKRKIDQDTQRRLRADPEYRERQRYNQNQVRQRNRSFVNTLKDQPCMDCGNKFPPVCMDFDHVRGEKVSDVSLIVNRSLDTILAEIEKCDLVCSNCHRVRTYNRMKVTNPSDALDG